MAELEIDQSNLPRVKEVCQSFAVLEDSVLAHSLQEQEIEQYYTTNIKKNQLVQNDIRMAKRMQDEEDEHRAQQSTILRQASRQIEEQDFEYAREIQDRIQRRAEADRRRVQDDEEMAKRLQEEEEQEIRRRRRSREQESSSEGSTSDPALPSPHQHTFNSLRHREEQYSPTTTRWQCSTSHNGSALTGPQTVSPRRGSAHINTTSWSNQGHADSIRAIRDEVSEPDDSYDSDTFFNNQLSLWSKRLYERSNTMRPQQQASSLQLHERNYRSLCSRKSSTDEFRCSQDRHEDCYENNDLLNGISRNREQRSSHRDECEDLQSSWGQNTDRSAEVRDRRCRSESVRLNDRSRHRNRDLLRTWSCKESPDKHVRFKDDSKQDRKQQSESSKVWEMLAHILRERGVPVRFGGSGAPLQIKPQSRDSQVIHGSEVSYGDSQPHQRAFQRAATTRHSFHGDIRERRRLSYRENNGRDHREDQDRHRDNGEVYEINRRDSCIVSGERRGSKRWKEHKYTNGDENGERNRVRRTSSERRHWHKITEERLSSEEEQEVERRVERPRRRSLQRSQSLSSSRASSRHRSRHEAAGASLEPEASLYLGELQQVLQDEELARKLQEEEEKLLKRVAPSSPRGSYPEGDFRVAQVAQDEEIARFMQKQEMKSKQRSCELEGPSSWHEHRAMISQHDRRAARDRQVRRERLDSEGLPSPTEDSFPENQPPSPVTTIPKAQEMRNVAEDLDPTFPARRQSTESFRAGHTDSSSGSIPVAQSGLHDFLEEPTFIPPTKRQTDKSGRSKPKEKKEGCKQQ